MPRKWKKAATVQELARVREIDDMIKTMLPPKSVTKRILALKAERTAIVLRCNVRGWRKSQ